MCFVDEQHWNADFNDQLHLSHYGHASWTHLQVKKSDVLREIKFDHNKDSSAQSMFPELLAVPLQ
jgi:hypothetical protein